MTTQETPRAGRPRSASLDAAILASTRSQLALHGLGGLSIAAIAEEAGTTRPAIYRRWPQKLDLALAAVADLAEIDPPQITDDPFADLVAELEHFRHCIMDASALALAGLMLQDGTSRGFRDAYRELLVVPRRSRITAIFQRGIHQGVLSPTADLGTVVPFCTGSWFAHAVAGVEPPQDWAIRVATACWRSCSP